ncbi:hypothetical protein GCM10009765_49730 [Fodinicola feengrottensis]|uniref:Uncharacterized protein n=1 Tax=Fodinicola feengrottensis TaxID=435914 RepID=A0ABN2HW10_9ACTN
MTMRTYHITGDLPYYVISCGACGDAFSCYDDSCYQRDTLANRAVLAGWSVEPHRCPGCGTGTQRQLAAAYSA